MNNKDILQKLDQQLTNLMIDNIDFQHKINNILLQHKLYKELFNIFSQNFTLNIVLSIKNAIIAARINPTYSIEYKQAYIAGLEKALVIAQQYNELENQLFDEYFPTEQTTQKENKKEDNLYANYKGRSYT